MKTFDELVTEQLEAAKELIEKGWCQEAYSKLTAHGTEYCAIGALFQIGPGSLRETQTNAAQKRLEDLLPDGPFSTTVISFNDDPHTTKEDVIGKQT